MLWSCLFLPTSCLLKKKKKDKNKFDATQNKTTKSIEGYKDDDHV